MTTKELRMHVKDKIDFLGIGLRQVEAETGVSFSTISRFLRGATMTYHRHVALENWLHGEHTKKTMPVSCKRMRVGDKTFLVTIEELK